METIIGNESMVQGERLSYEIKLVLVNGKVTLNGKTWSELSYYERKIFEILIIQERETITEILSNE
jgi:hypothetical protein